MQVKSIIHFSGDDYWISNPHSRYHIVKAFWSRGKRILWINPIGVRFPSLKKKGTSSRIFRKIRSLSMLLKKADENFYVYTPFLIPQFKESGVQLVNNYLLKFQILIICKLLKIKNPILFFTSPLYANALFLIKHDKSIYYYSDKYVHFRELSEDNKRYLIALDEKLYKNVNLILCASKMIYDDLKEKSGKIVKYMPHQVDFEFFNQTKNTITPDDIRNIPRPIIGYYGTLTPSNDWELIEYLAKARPNYNFVLIGRKEIHIESLEKLHNVHFLGKKDYNQIPAYGTNFDVCIMFWTMKEWIKNSSPLKLKEYLALGKPVVSVFIQEISYNFGEVVYIAKSNIDFLKLLDRALTDDNTERIRKGIKLVKDDSWIKLTQEIEVLLKSEL